MKLFVMVKNEFRPDERRNGRRCPKWEEREILKPLNEFN